MKTYKASEYLKIDIANHFGLDKELFETRIAWVDEYINELESLEDQAEDLYRYAAAVMALRDTQAGKPTGYLVGLDACASGPQIMSCFMRDAIGARNTGVIGQVRADIYTHVTKLMNMLLNAQTEYERKLVKKALMPFYYGSRLKPKQVFGEGEELDAFLNAQEQGAPGASKLMDIMLDCWQAFAKDHRWTMPDGYEVIAKVMADYQAKVEIDELDPHPTFTYKYKVNEGEEEGRAVPANVVQSTDGMIVREMNRRCNYDGVQLSRVKGLLARRSKQRELNGVESDSLQDLWFKHRFTNLADVEDLEWDQVCKFDFDYCDALLKLVCRCLSRPSFPVVMVHDEFKCHPNYMDWVRQTYIELLAEISDSNMIEVILSQITGEDIVVPKMADSISDQILKSEYALS